MPQGRSHRDLDEAGVDHAAGQRERLRAGALFRADGAEPFAAAAHDNGHAGEGFDVIEDGRLGPQALLDGARRLDARHTAPAFDRGGQGAALAADERACAAVDVDAEVEAAVQDVFTQQTGLLGLGDGGAQTLDSQRILRADVDVAFVAAGSAARDHHAL